MNTGQPRFLPSPLALIAFSNPNFSPFVVFYATIPRSFALLLHTVLASGMRRLSSFLNSSDRRFEVLCISKSPKTSKSQVTGHLPGERL